MPRSATVKADRCNMTVIQNAGAHHNRVGGSCAQHSGSVVPASWKRIVSHDMAVPRGMRCNGCWNDAFGWWEIFDEAWKLIDGEIMAAFAWRTSVHPAQYTRENNRLRFASPDQHP
jgi:hypothetical protein